MEWVVINGELITELRTDGSLPLEEDKEILESFGWEVSFTTTIRMNRIPYKKCAVSKEVPKIQIEDLNLARQYWNWYEIELSQGQDDDADEYKYKCEKIVSSLDLDLKIISKYF